MLARLAAEAVRMAECRACRGSGACQTCAGTGRNGRYACRTCDGKGNCEACKGIGLR